jgi:hypothetical protein
MVQRLPIPLVQITPIDHNDVPCHFLKLSMVRIFYKATDQAKKATLRNLGPPNTLLGKMSAIITDKDFVEEAP